MGVLKLMRIDDINKLVPNPDKPEKCLKCLKCAKMPKIMASLQASPSATTRQVAPSLLETADIFSIKNKKSGIEELKAAINLLIQAKFLQFLNS